MGIRENLAKNKNLSTSLSIGLILVAAVILAWHFWPEKKANLSQAFFSDDDGQTWFQDSVYLIPPFDHNGKTAVRAEIFTYDSGKKPFCAYLAKYTDEAKKRLEDSIAEAKKNGQPPNSASAFADPMYLRANLLVKKPGAGNPWVPSIDHSSAQITSIQSPDGSEVDQFFAY
jgi:hypothetical protein